MSGDLLDLWLLLARISIPMVNAQLTLIEHTLQLKLGDEPLRSRVQVDSHGDAIGGVVGN